MRQAALAILAVLAITGCKPPAPRCLPCSTYLPSSLDTSGASDACPVPGSEASSPEFENLAFQGGGVKGIAYAGALPAFGDKRLANVDRVAGTSAGAITALGVAVGYNTEQLCKISLRDRLPELRRRQLPEDIVRLFEDYGWYRGDYAQCFPGVPGRAADREQRDDFRRAPRAETAGPEVQGSLRVRHRRQHLQLGGILARGRRQRDVPLALAARISMSIPFFFAAKELRGDIFVDGGVLRNYPLDVFDDEVPNPETLGFHLGAEPPREIDR